MKARKWSAFLILCLSAVIMFTACSKEGAAPSPGNGSESAGQSNEQGSSGNAGAENTAEVPNLNLEGFPIVNEPIQLKFLAPASPTPDWNDVLVFNEYEKMTNMDIQWEMVASDALDEKRNLILSSGDYPDAFHSAGFTVNDLINYGQMQGIFIPLNDLIDKYAPNFKKLLEEDPDLRRGLTMPDGNIYSFPRVFDPNFPSVLAGWKLWLNNDFLTALNMEEPDTLDEFYAYLKAVKSTDLNGDGQLNEIPLSTSGDYRILIILRGAYGLGNKGVMHYYVDTQPNSDELRFIPTDPRYKELLQYVNKLYTEGLINQDLYTVKSEETFARATEGLFGAAIVTNPRTSYNQENFIGAPVMQGPYGDRIYSDVKSSLANPATFVITDKNPNPEATVRWIDYFYGDEGMKLFFMGVEGVTYDEKPDGTLVYTDLIENDPNGLTRNNAISKYMTWRNGAYPSVVNDKYFNGSEAQPDSIEAAKKLAPYFPDEVWAPFSFTLEETEFMSTTGADIQNYVEEMEAQFITGQTSFDKWDEYVSTLEKMGLKKYMEIYKDAYDRYKQNQ